jgi:hypothetical protein
MRAEVMAAAMRRSRTHQFDKMPAGILEIERSERPEGREASRRSVNLIFLRYFVEHFRLFNLAAYEKSSKNI